MAQSLGIVDLIWNGVKIPVEKGATFTRGGGVNKTVVAGRQNFRSQDWMQSKVKASTPYVKGQSTSQFDPDLEAELQFKCDTGQTFIMQAYIVDQVEITGGQGGKLNLVWEGGEAEEVMP
jgi:hypothetical protein